MYDHLLHSLVLLFPFGIFIYSLFPIHQTSKTVMKSLLTVIFLVLFVVIQIHSLHILIAQFHNQTHHTDHPCCLPQISIPVQIVQAVSYELFFDAFVLQETKVVIFLPPYPLHNKSPPSIFG